jgi:hypothetical protein
MLLHAQHCRPVAVAGASCFLAFGARKGVGATRIPSRTYSSACGHSSEGGAVLRCGKWRAPEAKPRAPGAEQKQVAESGTALHGFIYALRHSPLSFSLLCSYPAPQPPPDSPLNVALLCLACLLLSSSRFPCKRSNNKKSSAFKSASSFPLHCSYSLRAVAPAEDDRLTPLLHLRSQWCSFSLCCSW